MLIHTMIKIKVYLKKQI